MADVERREPESTMMRTAINEIIHERNFQTARWGTDHDKAHSIQDWATILTVYLGKAASHVPPYTDPKDPKKDIQAFRKRLVQLAAICVAAIEALDQK